MTDLKSNTSPNGKRVYVTPNGDEYPSITTVLGNKEKPWLKEWTNMLGPKKAEKEKKRCSDRGEAVHDMAERFIDNQPDFTKNHNKDNIRLFNQLKLKLKNIDNVRAQEVALYSDDIKIAGRVDCIAEYNGKLCVIDFKTSNNNKNEQMIEDYFVQCTAYAIMWHELTGEAIEHIVVLMAVEKGLVPLVFEKRIDKYIAPLLKQVSKWYTKG